MEVTGPCVHPDRGSVGKFYSVRIQKWLNWSPKGKLYCAYLRTADNYVCVGRRVAPH